MYQFVENNVRGGLSQISKRYAKANHKELKNYNPNQKDEFILYLDASNLYGYAMSQYLPLKDFKWNTESWDENKILQLNDEGNKGYLFDVNINYSDELHDLHNGYSLALENMIIKNEMLNDYQKEKRKETKISKLITNFYDKKNYGVNYRLLKLYLKLGLRITNECFKIHSRRLYEKLYFTEERTKAKNDFEKDFYKLMNNSVYGKTMENVRNRITFKIVSSKAIILKNVI